MRKHPGNRYGDLPKSRCGLRGPLHLGDGRLGVIHFVVNNAEELCRTINRVEAPSMVQTTTSILIVNMHGPIIHKHGPLIVALRISRYAILKEVTLTTPGEVVVWCVHFNMPKELFFHDTNRGLRDKLDIASGTLLQEQQLKKSNKNQIGGPPIPNDFAGCRISNHNMVIRNVKKKVKHKE